MGFWDDIKQSASDIGSGISNAASSVVEKVENTVQEVKTAATKAVEKVEKKAEQTWSEAKKAVQQGAQAAKKKVERTINAAAQTAEEEKKKVEETVDDVKKKVTTAAGNAKKEVQGAAEEIVDDVKKAEEKVVKLVSSLTGPTTRVIPPSSPNNLFGFKWPWESDKPTKVTLGSIGWTRWKAGPVLLFKADAYRIDASLGVDGDLVKLNIKAGHEAKQESAKESISRFFDSFPLYRLLTEGLDNAKWQGDWGLKAFKAQGIKDNKSYSIGGEYTIAKGELKVPDYDGRPAGLTVMTVELKFVPFTWDFSKGDAKLFAVSGGPRFPVAKTAIKLGEGFELESDIAIFMKIEGYVSAKEFAKDIGMEIAETAGEEAAFEALLAALGTPEVALFAGGLVVAVLVADWVGEELQVARALEEARLFAGYYAAGFAEGFSSGKVTYDEFFLHQNVTYAQGQNQGARHKAMFDKANGNAKWDKSPEDARTAAVCRYTKAVADRARNEGIIKGKHDIFIKYVDTEGGLFRKNKERCHQVFTGLFGSVFVPLPGAGGWIADKDIPSSIPRDCYDRMTMIDSMRYPPRRTS